MGWKFYGRRSELEAMKQLLSRQQWFFCAISGRRRIGKTSLIKEALTSLPQASEAVYLQIPDSDEHDVVSVFVDTLAGIGAERLPSTVDLSKMHRFADMVQVIGHLCRAGWIVILDEFQYFNRKSLSSFASLLQAEVDQLFGGNQGGIFVLGSIHTEMTALLEDRSSPLYARVTDRMTLEHWDFATLYEVFEDQGIDDPADWLSLWGLFEGVPKFYRDCVTQGVFQQKNVLGESADLKMGMRAVEALFFSPTAPLLEEAATLFVRELRGASVSILRMLAQQQPCVYKQLSDAYRNSTGDDKPISNYLNILMERYRLVESQHPVFSQGVGSRQARYLLGDNFLAAWLAAIEPGVQASRVQPAARALSITAQKLATHEGHVFERMVRKLMSDASRLDVGDFPLTDTVTGYWNRARDAARLIEIDVVAINETDRTVRFGSCKRSASKHDRVSLMKTEQHIADFLRTSTGRRFAGWKQQRALYAPEFSASLRESLETAGWICVDLRDFRQWFAQVQT